MSEIERRVKDSLQLAAARVDVTPAPTVTDLEQYLPGQLIHLDSMFAEAAETDHDAADVVPVQRRHHWRFAAAALSIAALALTTAAAAGLPVLPPILRDAFFGSQVPGAITPDPATVHRAFSVPSAHGARQELWVMNASHDGYCAVLLTLTAAQSTSARLTALDGVSGPASRRPAAVDAGGCGGNRSDVSWRQFGGAAISAGTLKDSNGFAFIAHVPRAVRVVMTAPGLRHGRQLPVGQGWTAGTIGPIDGPLVITGYDASGKVIGRRKLA